MSIPYLTRCRVCKCTEMRPCFPPCSWEPNEPDLCSNCAEVIREVRKWLESGYKPSFAALWREAMKEHAPGLPPKKRKTAKVKSQN